MKEALPDFADASARFSSFLREHGHCGTVVWVEPRDLALMRRTILFCLPPSDLPARLAYAAAVAGLGHVRFNAVAHTRELILATIRVPGSEAEAADHWVQQLTLSVGTPLCAALQLPSRALLSLAQRAFRKTAPHLPFLLGLEPYTPDPPENAAAV